MSNIVDMTDMTPNQATVQHLEKLLDCAKAGKLRSVIVVAGWSDDAWTHGWSVDERNTSRRMAGEIALMQFDMMTKISLDDGDTILAKEMFF